MGWVNEGELREAIDSVIQTMEKGDISTPIQVPGGVYVVALVDKRISNPDTLYNLQQVRVDLNDSTDFEAAKTKLDTVLPTLTSCDSLSDDLDGVDGVTNLDMGEIKETAMNDLIRNSLVGVETGQASAPIEAPGAAVSFFVCDKAITGANVPTRDQVENRLIDQQLAQASKRHLRDLRRGAAISIR